MTQANKKRQLPKEIKRENSGLSITWDDNSTSLLSSSALRQNCPCASCRQNRGEINHDQPISKPAPAKRASLKVIKNSINEELDLKEVWGVGNYAIGLKWGDGHATGIYTYEYLLELSKA